MCMLSGQKTLFIIHDLHQFKAIILNIAIKAYLDCCDIVGLHRYCNMLLGLVNVFFL